MSSGLAMSSISDRPGSSSGSTNTRRMSDGQHIASGDALRPMTRRKSSRTKSTGERDAELKRLRALLEEKKRSEAEEVAKHKEGLFAEQEDAPVASSSSSKPPAAVRTSRLRCKMCR